MGFRYWCKYGQKIFIFDICILTAIYSLVLLQRQYMPTEMTFDYPRFHDFPWWFISETMKISLIQYSPKHGFDLLIWSAFLWAILPNINQRNISNLTGVFQLVYRSNFKQYFDVLWKNKDSKGIRCIIDSKIYKYIMYTSCCKSWKINAYRQV